MTDSGGRGPTRARARRSPVELGISGLERPVEIGRGGFGVVYRARQPEFGRNVAVKVLRAGRLDTDGKRRFRRELRAMGGLSGHPNIVTVYSAGFTTSGDPYLVMGLEAGGSLADRLRASGPLPWEEAVSIGLKLAGALETAHRGGVLHRDVKPENVLLSENGEPKLADFGIARVQGGSATRTGAMLGTIPHAAPELLAGDPPSVASDVYALASTIFTLVRGLPPFAVVGDAGPLPMMARIGSDPVPDIRPLGVPDGVCLVLERAMAKNPADRPGSAEEIGSQLARVMGDLGHAVTPAVIAGKARPATAAVPRGAPAPRREDEASISGRRATVGSVVSVPDLPNEGHVVAPAADETVVTTLVADETRQTKVGVAPQPAARKKWRPRLDSSSRNSSLVAAMLALVLIVPVLAVALARHGNTDARFRTASANRAAPSSSSAATRVPSPASTVTPTVAPPPPTPPPPTDPPAAAQPPALPAAAPPPVARPQPPPPHAGPHNVWSIAAPMSIGRYRPGVVAGPDGRVYAIGGEPRGCQCSSYSNTVDVYAPSTNSWTSAAPMPTARSGLAVARGSDGRIYALGGLSDHGIVSTVEIYTPSSDSWSTAAALPTARVWLGAASGPDGRIYTFGGWAANGASNAVEVYTPSTNSWSMAAPMPTPRSELGVALGGDGRIYAVGGTNGQGLNTMEVYTPSTNSWGTAGPMPTPRNELAVVRASDGRIYAIGGANGANCCLNTVEVYSPGTGSWAGAAAMPTARGGLGAATGSDGRIYAIGGEPTTAANTAEAYIP